jgi:Reverse transcriptase (RNA-dependent DNA polymerase)/Group II intron, maturase-specific domain
VSGGGVLTRFADDFVVNFQYRRDAEAFHKNLTDRFGKFGLELAEEKTRVMRFGRFVRADLAKTGEKPDTFDFLGFKHVCGTDRGGKFALVRVPCDKSRRKFLAKSKQWLSQHRHWKRRDQQKQLVMMLRGFYQYFGLHHCKPKLDGVRREVQRQWARTLRRRSQRHRCGKSARRVLRGGTGTSVLDARLVPTHHSLPHAELLKSVARRVVDGAMLHLIKMWLEAPVEETDERGNKSRSTRNRDQGRGSPQGSPISPLLSNLYMRRFVLGWKKLGYEKRLQAYIVNYADDLVICCRGKGEEALATMRDMMRKLKLTVNEKKTRVCKLPEEKFDFLGYTFGRCYSSTKGRAYLGTTPSKKRVQRICEAISQATRRSQTQQDAEKLVETLNRKTIGWANYFSLGPVSKAYRTVERHTRRRLRQWLCAKHKQQGSGSRRYSDETLHVRFGLVRLTPRTANFPWATS